METRMSHYILALDQGTTSSRSLIFDQGGKVMAMAQREFTQHFPQPGWVEHDPEEILTSQVATAHDAVKAAGLTMADIAAVGITNQRETTVVWDRATGKAIYNAIVWQDRRTASTCDTLRNEGHARGAVFGLTRGSTKAHLARATLDSIAHQTVDVMRAMEVDSGVPITQLRVDGGATDNDLLMQYQSDILNREVVRPEVTETTALGAAYLAGIAVGYWSGTADIATQWKSERTFQPQMEDDARERAERKWQRAVRATLAWAEDR